MRGCESLARGRAGETESVYSQGLKVTSFLRHEQSIETKLTYQKLCTVGGVATVVGAESAGPESKLMMCVSFV